jgi:predicted nucleic acid-binding Zn ribbon protein
MKSGQMLRVQAINLGGEQVSYSIPLADFKKANEGPPADMKAMQEQQNKLRDELQKKAEEERKRLGLPQ